MFRSSFAQFALDTLDLIKSSTGKTESILRCELQSLKQDMTDILLGRIEPVMDIIDLSGTDIVAMANIMF
ncbi:MAG: hypothetical protein LUQ06_00780 [Methylococcaceae bacterium]|nr:hypothetical protein [Methylococcaceae bacterium]